MAKPDFYNTTEEIKSVGNWTWKDTLLWRKIQPACADQCWAWTGSTGPHANLFGARKKTATGCKAQMTQVPRLIWMSITGQDLKDLEVKHNCGNRYCCNPQHMFTKPNHMRYRKDGTALTVPRQKQPKKTQAKPVKEKHNNEKAWWQL